MNLPRLYQNIPLLLNQAIQLDDRAYHYLTRVLRIKSQDTIIIFNGTGGEYLAIITDITKKTIVVKLVEFNPREAESNLEIILAQGISRGEKMDFVIQKAVELGVSKIIPLFTEFCNVKLNHERQQKKWQHWQGIIVSACEQCGRNILPKLLYPQDFSAWINLAQDNPGFILSPSSQKKISPLINGYKKVTLLIGSEGGLSQVEEKKAISQGFTSLNLGPRILRTETAALAAIATLQVLFGDMAKIS